VFDILLSLPQTLHGAAAYGVLFLLLFLAGAGSPVGQDLLLLVGGEMTLRGAIQPVPFALVAFAGLLLGDALTFWTGRHFGARWIRRPWAARFVPPARIPGMEAVVHRFGAPWAFLTRFLPGQRGALFFIAGSLRMPYRTFLLWDGLAAILHVSLLLYAARALGWRWQQLHGPIATADNWLTAALVLTLLALWLRARRTSLEKSR
jgi:membrane protein DedA with SNARE-associated domain